MDLEYYLEEAVAEGKKGMLANLGGPFGAVIVLDGKIIARGCNMVTSANDPTAHAEIVAIRNACKALGTFNLNGAILFAISEPCPMCMSAIYWAGIKEVYYGTDRSDAQRIGFSDKFIYDELALPYSSRSVKVLRLKNQKADALFNDWEKKSDKTPY